MEVKNLAGDYFICTSCNKEKVISRNFYNSYSTIYKGIGKIPLCIDCIVKLYSEYLRKYGDEKLATYYMCRKLDVYYETIIYEAAKKQSNNKKTNTSLARIYIQKVNSMPQYQNKTFDDSEILYNQKIRNVDSSEDHADDFVFDDSELDDETKLFWGNGFSTEEYIFLELELANWKQTHKCDNQAEITLLREICIQILDIRKAREQKSSVGKLQKDLQELLKTASLDPAKANAASAGKSLDSWGMHVKDIEQFRPAEWHDSQEKYKDMDEFLPYIQNYIVRPIRNFITGNRDFQINDTISVNLDEEVDENE